MIDYFQFFILSTWVLSTFFVIYSYRKYRYISLFDIGVIFSWFYVFFRPLLVNHCTINKDIYYWNDELYFYGQIISITMLLFMQIGANLFAKSEFKTNFQISNIKEKLINISDFTFLINLLIVAIMFLQFGSALFPFNRGGGALSVSLPGAEVYFYILKITFNILIVSSLFLFFLFKKNKYLFYFIFSVLILLLFSKRGAVISPMILFIFLYSFYNLNIWKKNIFSMIDIKTMTIVFISVLVIFFGKIVFNPLQSLSLIVSNETVECKILKSGQQEFDLFWPAVLENSLTSANILNFPTALVGGLVLNHNDRLNSKNSFFQSSTDKLMLKYNGSVYKEKKFGISPNFFQFLFYYFSLFSIVLICLFGYLYRYLEKKIFINFFNGNIFYAYFSYMIIALIFSPFDFTLKYNLVYFVSMIIVFILYLIYINLKNKFYLN